MILRFFKRTRQHSVAEAWGVILSMDLAFPLTRSPAFCLPLECPSIEPLISPSFTKTISSQDMQALINSLIALSTRKKLPKKKREIFAPQYIQVS